MENLVVCFENVGATNPLPWALSEVKEKIPQYSRFLILKNMYEIILSPRENISVLDFDGKIKENFLEISKLVGEEKFIDFLTCFSKNIMYRVVEIFDEGNSNIDEDKIGWVILETDENGEYSDKIIGGLHESFFDFRDECNLKENK